MVVMNTASSRISPKEIVQPLLGIGLYTIPEAARLTRVSTGRIRRWISGYDWSSGEIARHSPPVWRPDVEPLDGARALSFRDLLEVRFVDAFLSAGVSWKRLRTIAETASRRFKTTHPFSTKRFLTDGRTIFDETRRAGDSSLEDLHDEQFAFHRIIQPSLHHGLEFEPSGAVRLWWPEAGKPLPRVIVIDPARSFGQPIVDKKNVPTKIIAAAVAAEAPDGEARVASWYGLTAGAVRAAARYEASLSELPAAA
jgi:uncharacterized protein (DUF433 family)